MTDYILLVFILFLLSHVMSCWFAVLGMLCWTGLDCYATIKLHQHQPLIYDMIMVNQSVIVIWSAHVHVHVHVRPWMIWCLSMVWHYSNWHLNLHEFALVWWRLTFWVHIRSSQHRTAPTNSTKLNSKLALLRSPKKLATKPTNQPTTKHRGEKGVYFYYVPKVMLLCIHIVLTYGVSRDETEIYKIPNTKTPIQFVPKFWLTFFDHFFAHIFVHFFVHVWSLFTYIYKIKTQIK